MQAGISELMILFALLGSPAADVGNDYVGLLPIEVYWEQQGRELAADAMLEELAVLEGDDDLSAAEEIRGLMAIRALGKLEAEQAVDALERLSNSERPFVSDRARLALGQIRGEPVELDDEARVRRINEDLSLLTRGTGAAVGQGRTTFSPGLDYEALIDAVVDAGDNQPFLPGEQEIRQMLHEGLFPELLRAADRLGNVRIDGVTFGLSEDMGANRGHFVAIVQGEWHGERFRRFLQQQVGAAFEQQQGDVYIWDQGRWGPTVVLHGDRRLAMVGGPPNQQVPTDEVIAALTGDAAAGPEGEAVNALLEDVDQAAPFWAVVQFVPGLREELGPVLPAVRMFDDLTLELHDRDPGMTLTGVLRGAQPEEAERQAGEWRQLAAGARQELARGAQQGQPMPDVLLDLLDNLDFDTDAGSLTVTTHTDEDLNQAAALMPFFLMGARGVHVEEEPIQPGVPQPVPENDRPF